MPKIFSQKVFESCFWDFTVNGGVISTIDLGLTIPAFSDVTRFFVKTVIDPASAGAATISFGITGTVDFLSVSQPFTNYTTVAKLTPGKDFNATPFEVGAAAVNVTMSIATATLITSGRLICFIEYTKFPY